MKRKNSSPENPTAKNELAEEAKVDIKDEAKQKVDPWDSILFGRRREVQQEESQKKENQLANNEGNEDAGDGAPYPS